MSEGFMGKKVNLFILLMLLLLLLGFGAVSVYYQYTIKNVNDKFDDKSTTLGMCETNLLSNITALKNAEKSLNSTTTDIRKYDVLYEQKAGELEEKEDELSSAKAEINRITIQKEVYKKQIDSAYAQIIIFNETIDDLEDDVRSLTNQFEDQKDRVDCLLGKDDAEEYLCI